MHNTSNSRSDAALDQCCSEQMMQFSCFESRLVQPYIPH